MKMCEIYQIIIITDHQVNAIPVRMPSTSCTQVTVAQPIMATARGQGLTFMKNGYGQEKKRQDSVDWKYGPQPWQKERGLI
jgi:hypothetical protein